MKPDKKTIIVPVLLITIGTGWLLTTLGVTPGVDWVWTLGLAVVGLLTFVLSGFDKLSFVVGPFFIATSCMSVLRQTGRLHLDIEVPILVIVAGVLILIARTPAIPMPDWIMQHGNNAPGATARDGAGGATPRLE
jgi:hypothetical protein